VSLIERLPELHGLLGTLLRREDRLRLAAIFLLFVPMAAIGTVTHELGHCAVAWALGWEPVLHHSHVTFDGQSWVEYKNLRGYERAGILADAGTEAQERWKELRRENVWITLGGPLQTTLTGTAGLIWLIILWRRASAGSPPGVAGWTATLLALFWSRELYCGTMHSIYRLLVLLGGLHGRSFTTDEALLSRWWGMPEWVVPLLTGAVGLAICVQAVWLYPQGRRLHLLVGGAIGGFTGFYLWARLLGPILLP
jgi:hypothetical protein